MTKERKPQIPIGIPLAVQPRQDDFTDLPDGNDPGDYQPPFDLEILTMTRAREVGKTVCTFTILVGNCIEITSLRLMEGENGIWVAWPKQRPVTPRATWQKIVTPSPEFEEFLTKMAIARWDALQLIKTVAFHSGRVSAEA